MDRYIKGVALDLEGTMINWERLHFEAFRVATDEVLGSAVATYAWVVAEIPNAIGGGDRNIAEGIANHLDQHDAIEHILEAKRRIFRELRGDQEIVLRDGVAEVVGWLADAGYPLAIASITPRRDGELYVQSTLLGELIPRENWVFREDVENGKPKGDVFVETARRMRIPPRRQLAFEDSVPGVTAARVAGSPVIAMPVHLTSYHLGDLMHNGARRLYMSWDELRIEAVIRNLEEELEA